MSLSVWLFVLIADVLSNDVDVPAWVNMVLAVLVALTALDRERVKAWLKK